METGFQETEIFTMSYELLAQQDHVLPNGSSTSATLIQPPANVVEMMAAREASVAAREARVAKRVYCTRATRTRRRAPLPYLSLL